MSLNPALSLRDRDPAAPHRLAWLLTACVILWPLWQGAGIQPGTLLDPANLQPMGQFLAAFLPPESWSQRTNSLSDRSSGSSAARAPAISSG